MKRIKAARLQQTLNFQLKEDLPHEEAVQIVEQEIRNYKARLERMNTKYRILSEEKQPDGSVVIEIKKQYNNSPLGDYLD